VLSGIKEMIERLRYLSSVNEQTIWEFYQQAIKEIISSEVHQLDLDEKARETIEKIRL
jgi:hypothetical protein